jgi:high affinity Mn2+ porin
LLWLAEPARADPAAPTPETKAESPAAGEKDQRWNLHAQSTAVPQAHPSFPAAYSNQNSLSPNGEFDTSYTGTVFLGVALWRGAQFYFNPELIAGSGLSSTHGLASFPNGEIYRVDDPSLKVGLARLYLSQRIDLGGPTVHLEDDANQLATDVATRRLTFTLGKIALNDIFDNNTYAHDPRTQFLNWVFMDNGAWDYSADTRGYTWAAVGEYNEERWAARLALAMVAKTANGMDLDPDLFKALGLNAELEYRYSLGGHGGKARLLLYANRAHMGDYAAADAAAAAGATATADITQFRDYRWKYGFGLNLEQEIAADLGAFARIGWNDGEAETWMFTEIDRIASLGLSLRGNRWGRGEDTVGLGVSLAGIASDHSRYLQLGGYGFMLGDGGLSYCGELLLEAYYSFQPYKWLSLTGDYQYVGNPAYNSARGPVSIVSGRIHLEI